MKLALAMADQIGGEKEAGMERIGGGFGVLERGLTQSSKEEELMD